MQVDSSTYDKYKAHSPGHGYEARTAAPTHIVVHSTSNPHVKDTPFASEANFLLGSSLASAHYLIGKDGRVVQFLDPRKWAAWHAGRCLAPWSNQHSIGVELHHSVGDPPYPSAQLSALHELCLFLMAQFKIPVQNIDTHGQIALPGPYKRKTDPSDMTHGGFLAWRDTLNLFPPAPLPSDPFSAWGPIGKPDGLSVSFAVPRAWLVNQKLGACVHPETYGASGRYSVTEFERGIVTFLRQRNTTIVEMFDR